MTKVTDANAMQNRNSITKEQFEGLSARTQKKVAEARVNDNIIKGLLARNTKMMQKAMEKRKNAIAS